MAIAENLSLDDLLTRAQAGDRQAQEHLFARCRNYLQIIARTQIGGRLQAKVDASDLVQQTLLEAHRDFARFHGTTESEWLGWLRQILGRNVADVVRRYYGTGKRQASREIALKASADSSAAGLSAIADDGETPSQQLMRQESELQVADALTLLPPDYREVIILRNLERLPFEEVAQRMGRSAPAAQMLWMRAIHKLREAMQGHESGDYTARGPG